MSKTFHLTIARLGENLFDGDAVSVTLPGAEGILTVLAHHEPLVSTLVKGVVSLQPAEGESKRFDISLGGIAEISGNQVTVLL